MKIVLTGANGFIGRHVLSLLINEGHYVFAVVRNKESLSHFSGQRCQIVEYDISKKNNIINNHLCQADVLIHLAWGGLPDYLSLHHIETELPTHYQFVKGILKLGIKNVLVAGTCFEYGMQFGPLSEDLESRPVNPYGFAKDTLRKQLQYLQSGYSFNLTWIRLFYIYGEGQSNTALFSQLKTAVQEGRQRFNMSGGEQLRDYMAVEEVARQLVTLAVKQQDLGVVNICSGKAQSVRGIVERWISKNNWNIKLNLGHYPYPEYEPFAFWGDNSKYQSFRD